jgi:uncharacterized peroxidase-related enzyme
MSRLPAIDPSLAEGETKHLLDAVNAAFNATPNLFRVAANSAAALNAMVQMNGALAKGALTPKIREAIALAVAEANQCDYCLSAHAVLGRGAGLRESEIDRARAGTSEDPKLAAILAFTLIVVRKRAQVGQGEVSAVKAAGVTDAELAEIMGNIAFNVYTNYLNIVADTEIDFPVVHANGLPV